MTTSASANVQSDHSVTGPRAWRPLAGVLLVALVLRVGLFCWAAANSPDLHTMHADDTKTYLQPAESLLRHGTFARHGVAELSRTPGYPVLLIPGVALGHVEIVTFVLQTLLSLATVALARYLTWLLSGNRRAALLAALLLACEPLSITYTTYLLPETLFTCLLVLALCGLVRYFQTASTRDLLAAAIVLAAATLVRPVSYYLPPLVALLVAGRGLWCAAQRGRYLVQGAAFLGLCFAPLLAWQARNDSVAGYRGFAAVADWNLYFYQGASVLAQLEGRSVEEVQTEWGYFDDERFLERNPQLRGAGRAEKFRFLHDQGAALLRQHPLTYAVIHLRGMAILALNPGASDALQLVDRYPRDARTARPVGLGLPRIVWQMAREAPLVFWSNLLLAAGLGLVYAAGSVGLLAWLARRRWQVVLVALVAGYFVAISGGPTCVPRLRHPAMPLVCVLAGLGLAELAAWQARRRQSSSATLQR